MSKNGTILLATITILLSYSATAFACWPCRHCRPNDFDLAHNFRWVERGVLAGMAIPSSSEAIAELVRRNVGLIVTLTCDEVIEHTFLSGQLNPEILAGSNIQTLYLPIKPHQPPTFDQVAQFIAAVESMKRQHKKATVVHCEFGKSRTGTMLACWLIKEKGYSARKAINKVAVAASLEQKEFITRYYELLQHRSSTIYPISTGPQLTTMQPIPEIDDDQEGALEAGFVLIDPPVGKATPER